MDRKRKIAIFVAAVLSAAALFFGYSVAYPQGTTLIVPNGSLSTTGAGVAVLTF